MNILMVGNKGMLATDLYATLDPIHTIAGVDLPELDIANLSQVLAYISATDADMIINCAAYTNVDACETNVDLAYAANAVGPRNLAIAASKLNIPLLHISTDYVFDGNANRAYLEDDFPNPLSVYGKSKLMGENFIKSLCNKYFILRTQWLYGAHGKNFVQTMLTMAEAGKLLMVVNDQFGSPTHTLDLCGVIKEIIETEQYGTYHVTNAGVVSWYEFTRDILELSGYTGIKLTPCTTAEFPRPAHRPAYSPMENQMLRLCGFTPLKNYKEALAEYLTLMNKKG